METLSRIEKVQTFETRGGNTRFVVRDSEGNEYTTFREEIGERARELEGDQVRITYHEQERGRYRNVYLDKVEPADRADQARSETDTKEAAWRTAVEAAPWLVGNPDAAVPPEDLYAKLKPFEERVAEDIEDG